MIYLTGAYRQSQVAELVRLGVGVMLQPGSGYAKSMLSLGWPAWAADNGCFAQGERFNLERYYRWLETVPRERLLFAVAPDVFGNAVATWERSRPTLEYLRTHGYAPAYVAQDGAEDVGVPWDAFDCLFVGGTTAWKLGPGAYQVVQDAIARGYWVHMGRVNSGKRLRYAASIGCHSADGTFLRFTNRANGYDGVAKIASWLGGCRV